VEQQLKTELSKQPLKPELKTINEEDLKKNENKSQFKITNELSRGMLKKSLAFKKA
jgi:hypothetical protein